MRSSPSPSPSTSALSPPSPRAATAVVATVLATGILLRKRNDIASYYRRHRGIRGLLQWLWLGDYLPPPLRLSVNELDQVEVRVKSAEDQLEKIEIWVERARLDSVDGSTVLTDAGATSEELKAQLFRAHPELRTRIGIFSNKLDTLAAMVDAVQSQSDEEVKRRKKLLSSKIVELMDDLDGMMASFNLESKENWEAALKDLNLIF